MSENLLHDLSQFSGTENYWQHRIGSFETFVYTDGVKFLAEKANAYWLLDAIASYQIKKEISKLPMQVWTLERNHSDNGALLIMRQDRLQPIEVKQEIEFTDFPLKRIHLWLIEGVLILPSEY